jgi:hypothetical protein
MAEREYVVGWGTLALLNAGIAQAQRRSGLTWFVASIFLGPIATLLIVLWYRTPQDRPAESKASK